MTDRLTAPWPPQLQGRASVSLSNGMNLVSDVISVKAGETVIPILNKAADGTLIMDVRVLPPHRELAARLRAWQGDLPDALRADLEAAAMLLDCERPDDVEEMKWLSVELDDRDSDGTA